MAIKGKSKGRSAKSVTPGPKPVYQPVKKRLLAKREQARAAKDFDRADAIRDQLGDLGGEVRDGADGARLVRRG